MTRAFLSSLALVFLSLLAIPVEGTSEPAALLRAIAEPRLDLERAVSLNQAELKAGPATLHLDEGILIPAMADGLGAVELVFLGRGRIEMEAPDRIEAGQLELFTGSSRLGETFQQAVLVAGAETEAALLDRPARQPDAAARQRAEALWEAWRKSREREISHVDRALLLEAVQDPLGIGFFGAWFRGDHLGDFIYLVEPDEPEQVWLGQFIPLELTEKEKRRTEKEIRREQRQGRSLGLEVEDFGHLNTWLSAPLRSASGDPAPGSPAFEPKKYTLDVRLSQPGLRLSGKARIDLDPVVRGSRVVGLFLPRDFKVERVTDGQGRALPFRRAGGDLTVILTQAPAEGEAVAVTVEYAGSPVEKNWNLTRLLDTHGWYPHAGEVDRATYDATFHWPKGFELVASGRRVEGGQEADGSLWERRILGVPSLGFSFEIGHFDIQTTRVGHIEVTFAFGAGSNLTSRAARQEVMRTVLEALSYFEAAFGPYPLDELTVSTAPRGFSQGLLGFLTISDLYLIGDLGVWNRYFGIEDRRLVIAHEVSHQWWGNLVGWTSYRDQWISEALAEHSAALYGRHLLRGELSGVEYSTGWMTELTDLLPNGRSIESLGPLVLGYRLDSSLTDEAYRLIVYKKGAVILNMLASLIGQDRFPQALREVVRASAGKTISTPELIALLEQATGAELDGFAEQLIYGTGLPLVLYTYQWERKEDGWNVKGRLRQVAPFYRRYKVVRTGRGTFDVRREAVPQADVRRSAVAVPLEIEVFDPSQRTGEGRDGANMIVRASLQLRGVSSGFSVPVQHEPKGLWLDRQSKVFGMFLDASRNPKKAAYIQAQEAADAGRLEEADRLFAQALAMDDEEAPETPPGRPMLWEDIQQARRNLNANIASTHALLLMDLDRDDDAAQALGRARRVFWNDNRGALRLDRMQARLEVRRGDYEKAWQLLRRIDRQDDLTAQDQALLAIAARETGRTEEHREALKNALRLGVDMSALEARPSPAGPPAGR